MDGPFREDHKNDCSPPSFMGGWGHCSLITHYKGFSSFSSQSIYLGCLFFHQKEKKNIMFCVCNCFSTEWFYFHPSLGNFLRHLLSRLGKGSVLLTADREASLPPPPAKNDLVHNVNSAGAEKTCSMLMNEPCGVVTGMDIRSSWQASLWVSTADLKSYRCYQTTPRVWFLD